MALQPERPASERDRATASSSSSSLLRSIPPAATTPRSAASDDRQLSDVRLFVANLGPSVSEHDLMTAFKAYGTLRKLDLVFHRSGPQKGQHKGFAFIEYGDAQHAKRARAALEGKPLRGRELHVHFATVAATSEASSGVGPHRRPRQHAAEDTSSRSTTMLSLVKNLNRKDSTSTRIAAMEAKLEAIRSRKEAATASLSAGSPSSSSSKASTSSRPAHLPNKPPSSTHR